MMVSTVLVLMMILPGLALFYGGLTRTKNMLSTMTQIGAAAALAMLIWVMRGYTMAFGAGGNAIITGFGKAFLSGVTPASLEIGIDVVEGHSAYVRVDVGVCLRM